MNDKKSVTKWGNPYFNSCKLKNAQTGQKKKIFIARLAYAREYRSSL